MRTWANSSTAIVSIFGRFAPRTPYWLVVVVSTLLTQSFFIRPSKVAVPEPVSDACFPRL